MAFTNEEIEREMANEPLTNEEIKAQSNTSDYLAGEAYTNFLIEMELNDDKGKLFTNKEKLERYLTLSEYEEKQKIKGMLNNESIRKYFIFLAKKRIEKREEEEELDDLAEEVKGMNDAAIKKFLNNNEQHIEESINEFYKETRDFREQAEETQQAQQKQKKRGFSVQRFFNGGNKKRKNNRKRKTKRKSKRKSKQTKRKRHTKRHNKRTKKRTKRTKSKK